MVETEHCDITGLYHALREITEALADIVDDDELAQETLDFLAMAVGLKPVCLLGRGADARQWVDGAAGLARHFGFHVIEGPFWDATPFEKFPDWYRVHTASQLTPFRAVYICSARDTARQVSSINAAEGRLSMTTEARLLGYPECCVVAHYDRAVRYHQAILAILKRLARGDEAQMQALLRAGTALAPRTEAEIAHMEAAFELSPASFGSWNRCRHCVGGDDSPSAALSRHYRALAETVMIPGPAASRSGGKTID